MNFHCCDEIRRNAVLGLPINGIDWLEVLDRDLPNDNVHRQRTLFLHMLKPPVGLSAANVRIEGGDRIQPVRVEWAEPGVPPPADLTSDEATLLAARPDADRILVVRTDSTGDRSRYVLRLVRSMLDDHAPEGVDPALSEIEFSFKVECESDFDCAPGKDCPPPARETPAINYLARDYASFRRLLLDRMSRHLPGLRQRSAADPTVMVAELLAYVGDHLSYQQDAIATEAYLGTARQRISIRRHATLVDYPMHEGCNARAWVHLEAGASDIVLPQSAVRFLTRVEGADPHLLPTSPAAERALRLTEAVFEPMHATVLRSAHNEIPFHTWGDRRCCLPVGSTRATLAKHLDQLLPGDFLLLEEVMGPGTGHAGDADPSHRQVVRLVEVRCQDPADPTQPMLDPVTGTPVTLVRWAEEDALRFPLCVSSLADGDPGVYLDKVSVARGNLVLVDHGATNTGEALGKVPLARLAHGSSSEDPCARPALAEVPARFRPRLAKRPLTHACPVSFAPEATARQLVDTRVEQALPAARLQDGDGNEWRPLRNLLKSDPGARAFVAEIDDAGHARCRFGDGHNGLAPPSGTEFSADYRVGNGSRGNVGAESIRHAVTSVAGILAVRNPLAARGGVDPETIEQVRRRAPEAFRTQQRAVTEADYAEVATRLTGVDNAAATLRWTGSWHTMSVTADRRGGEPMTADFNHSLHRHLDTFRMAGHDLNFHEPVYVALEIALHVCVRPDHFRSDVRRALDELFSARRLRDGRLGLFHPDNFSFGQTVYLSRLYAAAHDIPGVQSLKVTTFRRQGSKDSVALEDGRLVLDRLEIVRFDNNPNHPERGVLSLELHGGK
jgi:hypothetical protein